MTFRHFKPAAVVFVLTMVLTYVVLSQLIDLSSRGVRLAGGGRKLLARNATAATRDKSQHIKTRYPLTIDSSYMINNPDMCKDVRNLSFIIIVHTSPDHFDRRRTMRETWANRNTFSNSSVRVVFLLGLPSNKNMQLKIENENTVYHDIVQGNFKDSYRNLTHKGVLGYRWISENCRQAKMVVKVDDDVFLDIFKLQFEYLPRYQNKTRYILCHVRGKNTSPIIRRRDKLKWKVNDDEFRDMKFYPTTYCNGYAVLISPDIITGLYRASFSTPFFWVDDVYLYGLLPQKINGVKHVNLINNFTLNDAVGMKCYSGNKTCKYLVSNAWRPGFMQAMWIAIIAKLSAEARRQANGDLFHGLDSQVLGAALRQISEETRKRYPPQKRGSKPTKSVKKPGKSKNSTKTDAKAIHIVNNSSRTGTQH